MNNDLNTEVILDILLQLLVGHYYEPDIITLIPQVAPLVNKNKQLTQVFKTILTRTEYSHSKKIHWDDLSVTDQKILNDFFEYLYFTSPDFLKEIK